MSDDAIEKLKEKVEALDRQLFQWKVMAGVIGTAILALYGYDAWNMPVKAKQAVTEQLPTVVQAKVNELLPGMVDAASSKIIPTEVKSSVQAMLPEIAKNAVARELPEIAEGEVKRKLPGLAEAEVVSMVPGLVSKQLSRLVKAEWSARAPENLDFLLADTKKSAERAAKFEEQAKKSAEGAANTLSAISWLERNQTDGSVMISGNLTVEGKLKTKTVSSESASFSKSFGHSGGAGVWFSKTGDNFITMSFGDGGATHSSKSKRWKRPTAYWTVHDNKVHASDGFAVAR